MVSSKVGERYLQSIWKSSVGAQNIIKLDKDGICNKNFCQYYIDRFKIAILHDESFLNRICDANVSLFINMSENEDLKCNEKCHNISKLDIFQNGAYAIWHIDDTLKIKSVNGTNTILE